MWITTGRPMPSPSRKQGSSGSRCEENVCGTIPKVKIHYTPMLCNHCTKAACIEACQEGAII